MDGVNWFDRACQKFYWQVINPAEKAIGNWPFLAIILSMALIFAAIGLGMVYFGILIPR